MYDLFFSDSAAVFTIPAIAGTVFFLIRLTLMLTLGLGDLHGDFTGEHHGDSTEAFKVFSIQAIAAFLMGFGWGGLGALKGSGWDWGTSIVVAIVAGAAMLWLFGILLRTMYSLQTSGNIAIEDAIGRTGIVYASVPASRAGLGQVQVVVNDHQRIYNAVTDGDSLPTTTPVRVTNVNADHTLTVVHA